jgi:hypothetical protein
MPDQETSNHIHHYEVMGSSLSCWAECECGQKFMAGPGHSGVMVGSKGKIEEAIR